MSQRESSTHTHKLLKVFSTKLRLLKKKTEKPKGAKIVYFLENGQCTREINIKGGYGGRSVRDWISWNQFWLRHQSEPGFIVSFIFYLRLFQTYFSAIGIVVAVVCGLIIVIIIVISLCSKYCCNCCDNLCFQGRGQNKNKDQKQILHDVEPHNHDFSAFPGIAPSKGNWLGF